MAALLIARSSQLGLLTPGRCRPPGGDDTPYEGIHHLPGACATVTKDSGRTSEVLGFPATNLISSGLSGYAVIGRPLLGAGPLFQGTSLMGQPSVGCVKTGTAHRARRGCARAGVSAESTRM